MAAPTDPFKDPTMWADHMDLIGRKEVILHAYGMMLAFGYIFPAMAYFIHYRSRNPSSPSNHASEQASAELQHLAPRNSIRSSTMLALPPEPEATSTTAAQQPPPTSATYFLHGTAQLLAALVTFLLAGAVIANTYHKVAIHRTIGFVVLGLVVAQLGLGGRELVIKVSAMSHAHANASVGDKRGRGPMGRVHGVLGLLVIMLGLAQAGLGLNKLYPFALYGYLPLHVAYYASIVGWISIVVVTEVRLRK
ncbi:hypothetical protein BCR44DRAFT_34062 [Catenaria anguillulae PL171]|uniref:Cytochrome b561 domain-containing protein n=1 Tax=Catenaria anguillulae PL171 TaxID=765915 RepID=A0A1Y2HX07_9FUNG|nr:hypothetical protein BCR44DRAFT_34062 [Catenaria anguillulae PL171]